MAVVTLGRESSAPRTWDRLAHRYAAQEYLERRAIAAVLRLADVGPRDRLLDLATGTGLLLRTLADRERRPRAAVGIDRSAEMLARVGRLPAEWQLLKGDARAVPLADGSVDVVTCCYLLHLLDAEARLAVLREARRLLAPGGDARLVVATVWVARTRPAGRLVHALLRRMASLRPEAWGGLHPVDPSGEMLAAGLVLTHRVEVRRGGYPSLVLRARAG